jgi:SAM-dependent methyltransferase
MSKSLDLGCGRIPKNPFNADSVFGVDVFSDDSLNIVAADLCVEAIPFPSESFDFVTAFDFLEHIPRLLYCPSRRLPFIELMSEISRVLKIGGRFLAYTPVYPSREAFWDPTHVNFCTEETFQLYFDKKPGVEWARFNGYTGSLALVHMEKKNDSHLLTMLQKI